MTTTATFALAPWADRISPICLHTAQGAKASVAVVVVAHVFDSDNALNCTIADATFMAFFVMTLGQCIYSIVISTNAKVEPALTSQSTQNQTAIYLLMVALVFAATMP